MNLHRLKALILKECLQTIRDPSSLLIAVVLPLILLFIFGYGVNLDNNTVKIGIVLESEGADQTSLVHAFRNSRFLKIRVGKDRREFEEDLVEGNIRGIVIIPQNFTTKGLSKSGRPQVQVIADGSEPNIAAFVQNYAKGVIRTWAAHQAEDKGLISKSMPLIQIESRVWYNPELRSRNILVPGSIAIIMTLIGTLLTALVIAREWEMGTMESLMATPVTILEILIGKVAPYFILGTISMVICLSAASFIFDVPFRGSLFALLIVSSLFLIAALGQGLLISSLVRDQFVASQAALMSAFLPAMMLSGFVFEISAMPLPLRALTHIVSARYFITSLQTLFLAGTVWPLLLQSMGAMVLIGFVFYSIASRHLRKRID